MFWFLIRAYIFPQRGNLMSLSLWISIIGVSLGIVLLILVLSVMSGFQELLQKNYIRISSDFIVIPRHSFKGSISSTLSGVPGIAAFTPFNFGQGLVLKNGVGGVVLEGIDLQTSSNVTPWKEIWVQGPNLELQENNHYWIWLGVQLAKKLRVNVGESVNVLIAEGEGKRVVPFVVTAITQFGIYDHDLRYAKINLAILKELFSHSPPITLFKCRLTLGASLNSVLHATRKALGSAVSVKGWHEINQNIFLAVEHQKKMLFLILEILIALSAVNIISLLVVSAYHRRRDIAILRAMGMRLSQVFIFFLAQGMIVSCLGIILGIGLSAFVCELVDRFQPSLLSESIYNVTRLPIKVELGDVCLVSAAALALCLVFSSLPSIGAAMQPPVKALRYE